MRNYAQFQEIAHDDKCLSINMEKRTAEHPKREKLFLKEHFLFYEPLLSQKFTVQATKSDKISQLI
jgi:hypothetical protein